jgi:hypothetical protein
VAAKLNVIYYKRRCRLLVSAKLNVRLPGAVKDAVIAVKLKVSTAAKLKVL